MILIFSLLGILIGIYSFYEAFKLLVAKNTRILKKFKGLQEQQIPVVSKQFAILLIIVGFWLLAFNTLEIVTFHKGERDWSKDCFLVTIGIFTVGESIIKRKNGISK